MEGGSFGGGSYSFAESAPSDRGAYDFAPSYNAAEAASSYTDFGFSMGSYSSPDMQEAVRSSAVSVQYSAAEEPANQLSGSEIRQAQEQAVRESTDLIEVDSLGSVPKGITVVPVSDDGTFHDFALGNGYMVLLCTEEEKPFSLRAGATVTIHLEANDTCGMAFGVTLAGEEIARTYAKAQEHLFSYTVPSDGEYCFALMYAGSDASSFQNCVLTIRG